MTEIKSSCNVIMLFDLGSDAFRNLNYAANRCFFPRETLTRLLRIVLLDYRVIEKVFYDFRCLSSEGLSSYILLTEAYLGDVRLLFLYHISLPC